MANPFAVQRTADIEFIPRAGEFSADTDLRDPVRVVRYIQQHKQILTAVNRGFGLEYDPDNPDDDPELWPHTPANRPRIEGNWALVLIAFSLSRTSSLLGFHAAYRSSLLWNECGFAAPPSYATLHRRLSELERFVNRSSVNGTPLPDGFTRATQLSIGHARGHEPMIGRTLHVDATLVSSHAALIHCCPENTKCGQKQKQRAEDKKKDGGRPKGPKAVGWGTRLAPTPIQDVNDKRHEFARGPVEDEEKAGNRHTLLDDAEVERLGFPTELRWYSRRHDGETHYYCSRDLTAGLRAYTENKRVTWCNGFYMLGVPDALTGLPVAVLVTSAREQEYNNYERLMLDAHENLGDIWPQHIAADRGFFVRKVFDFNNKNAIASAITFRKDPGHQMRREFEDERVDRHGIPRCQHCGAEGERSGRGLGFQITASGTPIIRFRCRARITPACSKVQTINCDHQYRLLGPLDHTEHVFHQLHRIHSNREHTHLHWTQRYTVGGRDVALRDHRIGLAWQQLRANCALFLDWFRLNLRHGWFASLRNATNEANHVPRDATVRRQRVIDARVKHALNLPYGPAAAKLGIGWHDPPWRSYPQGAGVT